MKARLKDQAASLHLLEADEQLRDLQRLVSPQVDLEVRGPAALDYFGKVVWEKAFERMDGGEQALHASSWNVPDAT